MLTLSTPVSIMADMALSRSTRPARKRADRYHHGDLRRALIQEAVRTIQAKGVDAVTLRAVGQKLGVSRTALYRHFADKAALLAAVAGEGFRMLRAELVATWEKGGRGVAAFEAMAPAYVRFAIAHPSHYRVMFGEFLEDCPADPELAEEGAGAFQALVDAIVALQQKKLVRGDDPPQLATFIWAVVHGIAMLTIDRRPGRQTGEPDELARFAASRLWTGIAAERPTWVHREEAEG
jgi:AcrR family transcriptional regulator